MDATASAGWIGSNHWRAPVVPSATMTSLLQTGQPTAKNDNIPAMPPRRVGASMSSSDAGAPGAVAHVRGGEQPTEHCGDGQCRVGPPRDRHGPTEDRIGDHVGRESDRECHQHRCEAGDHDVTKRPRPHRVEGPGSRPGRQLADLDHMHTLVGTTRGVTAPSSPRRRPRRSVSTPRRTRPDRRRRRPLEPANALQRRPCFEGRRGRGGLRRRGGPATR